MIRHKNLLAIALAYGILFILACNRARDAALRELYLDGIDYIVKTQQELRQSRNGDEAADVINNSLPRLRQLIARKKALEKRYPEIMNSQKREEIHGKFPEFHELRAKARELYLYGSQLALKYRSHARFMQVSREGYELLAYF